MVKSVIQKILGDFGYEVRKKAAPVDSIEIPTFEFDREVERQIAVIRGHTMLPFARLQSLYEQVIYCETNGIAGSFVECGTWKGGAIGLMAMANLKYGCERRHLHLFDSFAGIPEPDETIDGSLAIQEVQAVGGGTRGNLAPVSGLYESVGTLQVNRDLLEQTIGYAPSHLHYHPGWFQETLPRDASQMGPIAILRLDGDWYASTKICLDHFFAKVVNGGFVIIDDYGRYEGCRKAVDEFMERENINAFLHRIDSEGRYLIKP